MRILKIATIGLTLINTQSPVSAQSADNPYQDLWYGYNQFIGTPDQKELLITCGNLSKNPHKIFERRVADYKLVKVNNHVRFMKRGDGVNTFLFVPAELQDSTLSYGYTFDRKEVSYSFFDLSVENQKELLKTFQRFVPSSQQGRLWQNLDVEWYGHSYKDRMALIDEWHKYFKILNTYEFYQWLNLQEGHVAEMGGLAKIQPNVKLRSTTIPEEHGRQYRTNKKYFFSWHEQYDCLSWRPFG